jgi:serine/threonine protein kinase
MGVPIFHRWADGVQAKDVIGYGTSGYVALLPNSNEVIKVPHPGDTDAHIHCAREIEVYKRFETTQGCRPQSIVGYRGLCDDGSLRLEYAAGGNFKQHLSISRDKIKMQDIFGWAEQAAQSLVFCHSNSVLHGDICCNNFSLDQYLNLKLS